MTTAISVAAAALAAILALSFLSLHCMTTCTPTLGGGQMCRSDFAVVFRPLADR